MPKEDTTAVAVYALKDVVDMAIGSANLTDGQKVKTLQSEELTVSIEEGKVTINGAYVTAADLTGSNGVIQVVDAVLMPKK